MFYNQEVINIRDFVITTPCEQSENINDLFFRKIVSFISAECNLLDIGTGNGFVLSEIQKLVDINCKLTGVDNSQEMVNLASKNLEDKAKIIQADNNLLPFEDSTFDIITAKNVTRFNVNEIYRILKPNGYFIFREYGEGKGLIEVSELFKSRLIRSRAESFYIDIFSNNGFEIVNLEKYRLIRKYNKVEDLINVTKSYPLINDYNSLDEDLIRKSFTGDIKITSDPFILVTKKLI